MKRTNIILDEKLIEEGKKSTGLTTTRAVVDFALRELLHRRDLHRILQLSGKIHWRGDLKKMRSLRGSR